MPGRLFPRLATTEALNELLQYAQGRFQTVQGEKFVGLMGLVYTARAENDGVHAQLVQIGPFSAESHGSCAVAGEFLGCFDDGRSGRCLHRIDARKQGSDSEFQSAIPKRSMQALLQGGA